MRQLILSFLCLAMFASAFAQTPEPVYSFAVERKPLEWYRQQEKAWKNVTEQEPKNAKAWYYRYYSMRNQKFHDPDIDQQQLKETIDQLLDEMSKHLSDSYEYNLMMWAHGGMDMSLLPYLEKAAKLGADRTEHLDFMINWGEWERDLSKRNAYALKKLEAGLLSPGMLNYNYNVLCGLEPNAIVFTSGDNDTYPAWALQAQGIRPDVTVINLSLLLMDQYRDKLLQEIGAGPWEHIWENEDSTHLAYERFKTGIVPHITANKKGLPVYVSVTVSPEHYTTKIEEDLYLCGLAYKFSPEPMDNMAVLKKNFEQVYALDYLEHTFYEDFSSELVKQVNRNYIIGMLKLYDHYKTSGETQEQEWIKEKILAVGTGTEDEEKVKSYIQ